MTRALGIARAILWSLYAANLAGAAAAGFASYAGSPADRAAVDFIVGLAIALLLLGVVEWLDNG